MVEITLPIILQILQTAGILVGIIYYITIMRNAQRNQEISLRNQELALESRNTNILTSLHTYLVSEEYQSAFDKLDKGWSGMKTPLDPKEFIERHGEPNSGEDIWVIFFRVCQFWNGIGALVETGLADFDVVYKLWGHMAAWVWQIVHPIILYEREYFNQPRYFEWFEYLNNRIVEHEQLDP